MRAARRSGLPAPRTAGRPPRTPGPRPPPRWRPHRLRRVRHRQRRPVARRSPPRTQRPRRLRRVLLRDRSRPGAPPPHTTKRRFAASGWASQRRSTSTRFPAQPTSAGSTHRRQATPIAASTAPTACLFPVAAARLRPRATSLKAGSRAASGGCSCRSTTRSRRTCSSARARGTRCPRPRESQSPRSEPSTARGV